MDFTNAILEGYLETTCIGDTVDHVKETVTLYLVVETRGSLDWSFRASDLEESLRQVFEGTVETLSMPGTIECRFFIKAKFDESDVVVLSDFMREAMNDAVEHYAITSMTRNPSECWHCRGPVENDPAFCPYCGKRFFKGIRKALNS